MLGEVKCSGERQGCKRDVLTEAEFIYAESRVTTSDSDQHQNMSALRLIRPLESYAPKSFISSPSSHLFATVRSRQRNTNKHT
jgi:hypothetical protein